MSDETMVPFDFPKDSPHIIKVIGVGGGGGNAVNHMYKEGIHDVTFVVCNTDNQALEESPVLRKLQLGSEGLGAGNRPAKARAAAEESIEDIKNMLNDGCRMAFITAGMGGGTGTGAAPIIAKTAKDMEILTVGIVTIPFLFEGNKKIDQALDGVEEMSKHVDALLVINNERLRDVYSDISVMNALWKGRRHAVYRRKEYCRNHYLERYHQPGLQRCENRVEGRWCSNHEYRIRRRRRKSHTGYYRCPSFPVAEQQRYFNSKKVLFVITYSPNSELMMGEMDEIHEFMSKFGKDVENQMGVFTPDETLENKVKFTILATGFGIKDVPGMDNVLKQRSLEEQKRLDDLEEEEQKKDERRSDYYGKSILKSSIRKKRPNIYIFSQEDLANDDIISMVETTPTYKRTKMELENIRSKATNKNERCTEPETTTNTGSMTITF